MESNYYITPFENCRTFSLFLAASLAGLSATAPPAPDDYSGYLSGDSAWWSVSHAFYRPASVDGEPPQEPETLQQFAERLLKDTEDSPQEVVDALNQRFWSLV
jgi:hypothetical protein